MQTTEKPVTAVELRWAGDDFRSPQHWRVANRSAATKVLQQVANDIGYHGGDPDTAGLVATALTYKLCFVDGTTQEGIVRVRYQSKPDFRDFL